MDWGSAVVGLAVGVLVGPRVWDLARTLFSREDDEEAGVMSPGTHIGRLGDGDGPLGLD